MGYAVIAFDRDDPGALERRMQARGKHLELITKMAADGRLALGMPLQSAGPLGSLMVLNLPDRAGLDAYLAAEPFAQGNVWQRLDVHPFRIAPLPYRPLVTPGAGAPSGRTHTVIIAFDGTDAGAEARRLRVRQAHLDRVVAFARDGTLAFGGAILDETERRMRGSIAVVRCDTDEAARAWMAEDPYVTGDVWRDITLYGTRFAPLPYRPLPGAEHA